MPQAGTSHMLTPYLEPNIYTNLYIKMGSKYPKWVLGTHIRLENDPRSFSTFYPWSFSRPVFRSPVLFKKGGCFQKDGSFSIKTHLRTVLELDAPLKTTPFDPGCFLPIVRGPFQGVI